MCNHDIDLKQYYAQCYAYVKQNAVTIIILLQLHQVLPRQLIAPVMYYYYLLFAFGFIHSGVNFFVVIFFVETLFLIITKTAKLRTHKNFVSYG